MKINNEYINQISKLLFIGLLMIVNSYNAFSQFQSSIGFPFPTNEKSPGGILTTSGDFLILGDNNHHPNAIGNLPDGDLQLVWLDNSGNFTHSSDMMGLFPNDEAAWIERASCNGTDHYIVASSSKKDMVLTLVDQNGIPIWTRYMATPNSVLKSSCVKVDGADNFILVGTQLDLSTGKNFIVVVKVDCSGNQIWNKVYFLNNYSVEASSLTTFTSFPGICPQPLPNAYFITGKITSNLNGNTQAILFKIDALNGSIGFMKTYASTPNSEDVFTCIQANCLYNPLGELWISGYSKNSNGSKNILMMKTDINGIPIWTNNYDIVGGDEFANHFEFAANNKLVLTGKAEENIIPPGDLNGNCLLLRMDDNGNNIDWSRIFTNNDFSSQGNRVEVLSNDEYFIAGQTQDSASLFLSTSNILTIKTDAQGQTTNQCFHDTLTQIINHTPVVSDISLPTFGLSFIQTFDSVSMGSLSYNDQKTSCQSLPPVCDFNWLTKDCFEVDFTGTVNLNGNFPPGIYTFTWDFDCNGPLPSTNINVTVTSTTITFVNSSISHTFPCGGGLFPVCLSIIQPSGQICNVVHTISVPGTCCGKLISANVDCTLDSNVYAFTIVCNDPISAGGINSCSYALSTSSGTIIPGSLLISQFPNVPPPNGVIIQGNILVPNPILANLNFIIFSNCICTATGLAVSCSLPVSIPTICCKEIHIDDQFICKDDSIFNVPILAVWPPLNNIYHVSWYIMPKPKNGCPPAPWGINPYIDLNLSPPIHTLPPLSMILSPNLLTGDFCIYAVVDLNDGPCLQLISNVASIHLCTPDSCFINGYDYCYADTCIVPGLLTLNLITHPNACQNTIDWYNTAGQLVQNGGNNFQPKDCLSMTNNQNCFQDFYYTAVITDICGKHSCAARIRLYSDKPKGSLDIVPFQTGPFCLGEDLTIKYSPNCDSVPPNWTWYSSNICDVQGAETPIPLQGSMNTMYNTNQLFTTMFYYVKSHNGVCPEKTVSLDVLVNGAPEINFFTAIEDCSNKQVDLTLDFKKCRLAGCKAFCDCTYTIDWYKDTSLIGITSNIPNPPAIFQYKNDTLEGNYYAILKSDCCPDDSFISTVIIIELKCIPKIIAPCFICDHDSVLLSAESVIPPD
ncbi:MAG TPA: hypothetical protein VK590_10115, partial [Saprospiraceae bacterium]|nr:hypothetical protein [Saprospiraceae bacterium]